jgi:hypothetical protein
MAQTVSEIIYEAFFTNLSRIEGIQPETIRSMKFLYEANQITSKPRLTQLVQEMEAYYAQHQETKCK